MGVVSIMLAVADTTVRIANATNLVIHVSSPSHWWEPVLAVAGFLGVIAAFWSAHEARKAAQASLRSASETRLAVQAQLLADFLREYSLPKMKESIRRLGLHKVAYGEHFDAAQEDHLARRWPSADLVDEARRYISQYFFRAYQLRLENLVDEAFFLRIGELDGVGVLLNVCEPLIINRNPHYNSAFFDRYRALQRQPYERTLPLVQVAPPRRRVEAAAILVRRLAGFDRQFRAIAHQIEGGLYVTLPEAVLKRVDRAERL